jgi:Na+-driven multidrug efflux pump
MFPSHPNWGYLTTSPLCSVLDGARLQPTLAMRLATPMLSLVDSAVVGRFGTAAQLASLTPGTILCDSSAYVLTFLGIATTNLYATALAEGNRKEAREVLNNSLALAVICGSLLGLGIYFLAPPFLSFFTGTTGGEVLVGAQQFSGIRALGAPAGIVTMVSQALCFGTIFPAGSCEPRETKPK